MASRMTFSVPEGVKKKAQHRRDVNWSGVVTKAIEDRIKVLELADRLAAQSKLTEKDVDELAKKINRSMARRLGIEA